jgi:hypothetical protein
MAWDTIPVTVTQWSLSLISSSTRYAPRRAAVGCGEVLTQRFADLVRTVRERAVPECDDRRQHPGVEARPAIAGGRGKPTVLATERCRRRSGARAERSLAPSAMRPGSRSAVDLPVVGRCNLVATFACRSSTAVGTFDVDLKPGTPQLNGAVSRFELTKTFRGDLDASASPSA